MTDGQSTRWISNVPTPNALQQRLISSAPKSCRVEYDVCLTGSESISAMMRCRMYPPGRLGTECRYVLSTWTSSIPLRTSSVEAGRVQYLRYCITPPYSQTSRGWTTAPQLTRALGSIPRSEFRVGLFDGLTGPWAKDGGAAE